MKIAKKFPCWLQMSKKIIILVIWVWCLSLFSKTAHNARRNRSFRNSQKENWSSNKHHPGGLNDKSATFNTVQWNQTVKHKNYYFQPWKIEKDILFCFLNVSMEVNGKRSDRFCQSMYLLKTDNYATIILACQRC